MWGWFGGASAQKRKDGPKNAILMLRQQLDMLQKRERHLESQMKDQEAIAKKNLSTNRTGKDKCFQSQHVSPLHDILSGFIFSKLS
jgi:charged multivesicular body protein 4A/B